MPPTIDILDDIDLRGFGSYPLPSTPFPLHLERKMPTASTSSKQEPFVPSYERAELTREAELRRLQTVNFLSKLQKDGIASEIRRTSNERIDEKCYFKCWQPRPQPGMWTAWV